MPVRSVDGVIRANSDRILFRAIHPAFHLRSAVRLMKMWNTVLICCLFVKTGIFDLLNDAPSAPSSSGSCSFTRRR